VSNSKFSRGIELQYDHEIEHYKMESALGKIYEKPVGKSLIDKITKLAGEDKQVKIKVAFHMPCMTYGELNAAQREKYDHRADAPYIDNITFAERISRKQGFLKKGEGVASRIAWNPKRSSGSDTTPDENETNSFIGLAHELIHSYLFLNGTTHANHFLPYNESEIKKNEYKTIGLGRYQFEKITENKIRKEHNIPKRKKY